MTKKKPLVVVTRRLPELVETRMRELFDARLNLEDKPMSQADIVEAMREADVLVPTITDQINAAMIAQAGEQMRLIANFGNGVDHIDVTSALRRGITVTNTPGVLTEDTADMTMALILSTARRLVEGSRVIPEGRWTRLVADLDARAPHYRQASRHCRHGTHRPGAGPAGARLRHVDPLSQSPSRGGADRGSARGDLLGFARPDAGAHGFRLDQLPAYAWHFPPSVGPPAEASASRRHSHQYRARRDRRRERARSGCSKRANSPTPGSMCSSTPPPSTRS